MKRQVFTHSPKETYLEGEKLADELKGGSVVTLDGDLGAGKTVMAKGIAAGLGVNENVTSPTFVIVREYTSGRLPLYHFDAYRINEPDEMSEIGFDEYLSSGGVCVVEWSENIKELIPEDAVRITIERVAQGEDDLRKITYGGGS